MKLFTLTLKAVLELKDRLIELVGVMKEKKRDKDLELLDYFTSTKNGFDVIQDVHGLGDELEGLLEKLGYTHDGSCYSHPDRIAIFLGDLIDGGSQQRKVISIAKGMQEHGRAIVLCGNHEFNAIAYSVPDGMGGYLRPHNESNRRQHQAFLDEYPFGSEDYFDVIRWFKGLPVLVDCESFQAIHACWDVDQIAVLIDNCPNLTFESDDIMRLATCKGHPLYDAVEVLLKGKEFSLPNGVKYSDKYGKERSSARLKWWVSPEGAKVSDLALSLTDDAKESLTDIDACDLDFTYSPVWKPTFCGHYKLPDGSDGAKWINSVLCIDFTDHLSAYSFELSNVKGGQLVR